MISDPVNASWCEIYPDRISENLKLALEILPPNAKFCAVLKADAYGHGIAKVVPIICDHGVRHVGISSNAEARAVRDAGFDGTLIRLRSATVSEMKGALIDDVQEQVSSLYAARAVREFAPTCHQIPKLHLALNSGGMSRDGLDLSIETERATCMEILKLVGTRIVGIGCHYPSNSAHELGQSNKCFEEDVNWVFANSALSRDMVMVHAGSSLSLVSTHRVATDMFRCGAILYGVLKPELGFRQTMELKSRVTNLGSYPKGSTVGYDRASTLGQDRLLANISLGYANGFDRSSFGRGQVLIRGHKVPILGKVSMNTIVADVTGQPDIGIGDEVVVFGQQGPTHMDVASIEQQFGTIIADLYSDWGHRNPRIYR